MAARTGWQPSKVSRWRPARPRPPTPTSEPGARRARWTNWRRT
ncbi:hypothetical protein ACFQVA_36170 [Actinomadura keratinilytica]